MIILQGNEDIKDNCFSKMYMYIFNIFNQSTDKDHITTMLTCLDVSSSFKLKNFNF